MFEIEVGNKKYERFYTGTKIYVGRPSPLGNPFAVKDSQFAQFKVSNDEEAVAHYRQYLWNKIKQQDAKVLAALQSINQQSQKGKVVILCWCVNRTGEGTCHAHIIKKAVEWFSKH
jgi:hypothetical protein